MKILTLIAILAVSGCAHEGRLPEEPAQAAAQIRTWVPVGTSQTDAQRIMEQHHFTCAMLTNSSFEDLKAADFLYCSRSASAGWPVQQRWQTALILIDGKVSDVRVSTYLVGP